MKANELMIGDWVMAHDTPRKVAQITKHKIGYHLKEAECVMHYSRVCEISPIPLTPEILEKNGFTLSKDEKYYYPAENIRFIIFTMGGFANLPRVFRTECGYYPIALDYVHELQHALRLCGLDDLADNFKI